MGTLPDLTELRTKLESTILSYHSLEEKDWTLAKKLDTVTAWKRPSTEFNGYLVKVQGVVMDTPQRIIDHIRPGPCRKEWDKMMTSLEIVETVDKDSCVVRYTTAGLLLNMISPREFVDFCFVREYENGLLFCGKSIPYEPSTSGCVRGFNHPCAWLCVPVDESQSLLIGYLQTDLGGLIPQFAVESAMANTMGSFYTELGKVLKK
ncbi:stAR-related lipid transfer protein 4-like [Astyanax mexicanus]|uniref:StAR related lipid transfer domain containing 4 n=1 Tax=Astyanax mexicanus TaxID=7994 RepID=A0A8B9KY09_ASTMX|nr:stAR-related lipid transfer protein 4-like [Astyanax mexicanus]